MSTEKNLLYTKEHEWLKVDGEYGYVGITNHAQSELGDIIFVEFPNTGESFNKDDVFGTIEAVKTVADLYITHPLQSNLEDKKCGRHPCLTAKNCRITCSLGEKFLPGQKKTPRRSTGVRRGVD